MLDHLTALDRHMLLALNGSGSLFLDALMWTLTQTITWTPLLAGIVYVLLRNRRPAVCATVILAAVLLVAFTDQFSSSLCKPLFHRLRPTREPGLGALVDVVHGYRGGMYGFISSHAANTFGAAMFFTLVFRHAPTGILLFLWAALSSYTRLYLGVHYPLDILCGALFGTLSGALFWLVCHRACRGRLPRCDYGTARHTASGYMKSTLPAIFLMASVSLSYALVRAVVTASWL